LGISPVSYERFLNLTDEDVAKFIYSFYNAVQGSNFPDSISLAMTEAGWMSGTDRAFTHLYDALKNLGQTANSKTEAVQKAKILPEKVLFDEYIKLRRQYLQMLLKSPKYATNTGWISRLQRFYDKFNPDVIGSKKKNSLFNLSDIIDSLFGNK
jgi:lysozyme family protein